MGAAGELILSSRRCRVCGEGGKVIFRAVSSRQEESAEALFDALLSLYEKYGWYGEKTHNLIMPGLDGIEKMAKLMAALRNNPPREIAGTPVVARRDYQSGTESDCVSGAVTPIELSGSNVLRFALADGTVILVRPSGTEPKIKVYILTQGRDAPERDARIEQYSAWATALA